MKYILNKSIFYLPAILILCDCLFVFDALAPKIIMFRTFYLFSTILLFLIYQKSLFLEIRTIVYLLFIYFFILLMTSTSDFSTSLERFIKLFTPFIYLFIGILTSKSRIITFSEFLWSSRLAALIFILNFPISTLLNVRVRDYIEVDNFSGGNLIASSLYSGSVYLVIFFFLSNYYGGLKKKSTNKLLDYLVLAGLCIVLLLSLRRTAIISPLISISFLIFYRTSFNRVVKLALQGLLVTIVISTQFLDILEERYKARENRFTAESIADEGRYLETVLVTRKIFSFDNFKESLFGKEFLNSSGNYGYYNNRVLHVDLNQILHGSGILGLLIYLFFLGQILFSILLDRGKSDLKSLTISIFILICINSLSSGLLAISYRTIVFLIVGNLIGFLGLRKNEGIVSTPFPRQV